MTWIFELYRTSPTAQAIALIALVCALGMTLGSFKVKGIGLGTAGVLFVGIVIGSFSKPVGHATLEFAKEFGLLLFVFCIGLQLGPSFLASLRQSGLRLNLLATAIVLSGGLLAVGLGWMKQFDPAALLGLLAGATTNTPSLAAAQQTLATIASVSADRASLPALAYAVSYPVAIVGMIGTIILLKRMLKIDPHKQAEEYAAAQRKSSEPILCRTFKVANPGVDGANIGSVTEMNATGVVVTRVQRPSETTAQIASSQLKLFLGDLVQVTGTERGLHDCQVILGPVVDVELTQLPADTTDRRVIVTNRKVLGRSLRQLALEQRFSVAVTRVFRADLEMTAVPEFHLQFGDVLQIVGSQGQVRAAAELVGDSVKALDETQFVPLFAGIVLGVALGTLPLEVPGLSQPLRLGLAGGPLIVALIVSRIGRIGPLVWHMPQNTNLAFREFGIAVFFASVGLIAGPQFFEAVFSWRGLLWLVGGLVLTTLPLIAVGYFALAVLKMNFVVVSGLLAGSMTDPPALAFATTFCQSEAPLVSYAAVYPLTTVMRILVIQVLAVFLCG